jgi:hypothetical protein
MTSYYYGPGVSGQLKVDSSTGALEVIDYSHHEIHGGSHYYIGGHTDLDNGSTIEWTVTTPDSTKWAHMTFSISGSDVVTVDVYENTADIVGGTAVTPINNNRNSSKTSILTVKVNPTSVTAGDLIDGFKFGSSGGGNAASIGGGESRENELVLKQNTSYLWRVVSGADGNFISYHAGWYEHTSIG